MRRIDREPEKFEIIDVFETLARKLDLKLNDGNSQTTFLNQLANSFGTSKANPIIVHGRRVESMFEYVAASLGKCILIKREDSGDVCSIEPGIIPPDFRLVLADGRELFVEVKNCHRAEPSYRFRIKDRYLKSLQAYAAVFGRELRVAIFWSRWKKWTLVDPQDFREMSGGRSISFLEALPRSQMTFLGDLLVGTKPPLVLRLIADSTKPRALDATNQVTMTIGNVELYCDGQRIDNQFEKQLAFYFMLYSDWLSEKPRADIVDKNLAYIEFQSQPQEPTPNQGFQLLGCLSDMISRHYNELTAPEGDVVRLSPATDPGTLGVLIPPSYQSKHLPLWRFAISPT